MGFMCCLNMVFTKKNLKKGHRLYILHQTTMQGCPGISILSWFLLMSVSLHSSRNDVKKKKWCQLMGTVHSNWLFHGFSGVPNSYFHGIILNVRIMFKQLPWNVNAWRNMYDAYIYARIFEPHRDKTSKMACTPSEDSDHPGHEPSLIRLFAVCRKKAWILSYLLQSFCWFCHESAHLFSDWINERDSRKKSRGRRKEEWFSHCESFVWETGRW